MVALRHPSFVYQRGARYSLSMADCLMSITKHRAHSLPRPDALALISLLAAAACTAADSVPAADRVRSDSAVISAPQTAPAAVSVVTFGKAYPVDEGPRQPEFAAFRDSLLRIVGRRDTTALFAVLAPEIKSTFGGDEGIPDFREHWRLSEPDSELWTVLEDVLRHGGGFASPDAFYAPYTFQALPDSLDAFEHLVIRDSGVVVYERPDATSAPLATLSFDIVRAGPYTGETSWRAISIGDGRTGYVEGSHIRSPIDYRAGFERRQGRWWLVVLVAGD